MTAIGNNPGVEVLGEDRGLPLVDLVDRLLEKGAVLAGDLVLSVAGVDLVQVGLRAILQGIDQPVQADGTVRRRPTPDAPSLAPCRSAAPVGRRSGHAGPIASRAAILATSRSDAQQRAQAGTSAASSETRARGRRVALDADDVERGLVQLVLTVVDLLREVLERQALRRVDAGSLGNVDVERLGSAFLELEARMADLKAHFGLNDDDLRLKLGVVRDVA